MNGTSGPDQIPAKFESRTPDIVLSAMQSNPNREIAIRLRERFEFYFVALAFTIVAFSIQTAHFGSVLLSSAAELAAWFALLLAGIVGLQRIHAAHVIYDIYADLTTLEGERREFAALRQQGVPAVPQEGGGTVTPEALVQDRDAEIASAESRVSKTNKTQARIYHAQRILLIAGIALLTIARGYEPFLTVVQGSLVYRCIDSRTKLPVFFEISAHGFVNISAHHRDGQVYVFIGELLNYSRFFNNEIYYRDPSQKYSFGLTPKTGSFYITDKAGDALFSGTCKL